MIRRIRNVTSITIFLTVLLLASSAFGTNWFVDTTLATGNNDGTTMDDAWQSIETAMESTGFSAGDYLWIRRTSSFASASSNIEATDDGTAAAWITFEGWPRNSHAISSSDWTNGSTSVNVDDADMDREKHQGRYITAPDSRTYLITRVVDASTITIDREYVGSTASNAAATISADEDYTIAQAIDDSAWTIKKTNWNADADDLPKIDFEATAYYLYSNGAKYINFKNLEISKGAGTSYLVYYQYSTSCSFWQGCLFKTAANGTILAPNVSSVVRIKRCIFEGSGSGTSQYGIFGGQVYIEDSAVYNVGSMGIVGSNPATFLKNVNVGVEIANGSHALNSTIIGYDVKLGGSYWGQNETYFSNIFPRIRIENFQKTLGYNVTVDGLWPYYSKDVVAGSGDPYKRTGGADKIVEIAMNSLGATYQNSVKEFAVVLFEHVISADTSSKTYRYYVQLKDMAAGLTADQLYIECWYASGYDDTSEYTVSTVYSDETPADRTGADDWSQYIEVTVQPAVASVIHLRVRLQGQDTDGYLYIDPLPYIY